MKFNSEDFLPIGSVVRLKEGTKKIMIIGFLAVNMTTKKRYDYAVIPFPEGLIASDKILFCNHDQIENVYFLGYNNIESSDYRSSLNIILEKTKENESSQETVEVLKQDTNNPE